jgi:two-component system NarL family sensor kinase
VSSRRDLDPVASHWRLELAVMADATVPMLARSLSGLPPRLRGRVALSFAAVILVTCIVAAALLISNARHERDMAREHTLRTAIALSVGFDQEVAAGNALLKGLSSSPALKSGDARAFYDQLKATPLPHGSWLILQDLDGQVANTLRPFGAMLPRHRDFPSYPDALNRVRERGWTVSGRMASIVEPGTTIIALSLRIDHDDGTMKGFITTILSQDRLGSILEGHDIPSEWMRGLYDRKLQPIVTTRGAEMSSRIPIPGALATHLAAANRSEVVDGVIEDVDERGVPVLVAYSSSAATNWTSIVAIPLSIVNAPLSNVLHQIAGMAVFLLLAGGLAASFMAREVERPLRTLSDQVTGAKNQVSELSGQLLALQEEERQRIARELHDSTAQHLVAANLRLSGLESQVRESQAGRKILAEVESLLTEALRELRIFAYLLHPPNLATDGLQTTLREFSEGFAERTGLVARIRIPEEVDGLPQDLQRSILRVVQEGLTNVHRHAGASRVSIAARIMSGRLVVRIVDNGHGMIGPARPDGPIRLGVGIAGMHARLKQFGGDLRIRTGRSGTRIVTMVPISRAEQSPLRARLRMSFLSGDAKARRKALS